MEKLRSEYLSASAGSGKTFALSQRFCRLVMAGCPPEEICALTFTRPATREIFAAIIERLLTDTSLDGKYALSREVALARILAVLPRLQISTIDSFSSKVARLFAYEVGLDPDFSLYEGELSPEGQALQNEMVRRAFNAVDAQASKELLDVFDIQERFVAETRPLSQQWKEFWQTYASILENNPKGWGDLEAIGVEPSTKREPVQDLVARAQELINLLRQDKSTDKRQVTQLQRILDGYHVQIDSLRQLKHQWKGDWRAEKNLESCAVRGALTSYGKTMELADELQTIFNRLLNDMVSRDLLQAAQHTKSLYQALSALKQAETQLRKETGLISFDGVTRALSEAIGGNLSVRNPEAFYVAYRLDSAIRHLMIDEFQDTSTSQWQVLSGVAHELAAPHSEDGTFFYVGDVKQSIYAWRGGDYTLFADSTRLPDIPAGQPLIKSYRSSPTIISFVNQVMKFDLTASRGEESEWQYNTLLKWNQQWVDHVAHKDTPGYVQMLTVDGKREEWVVHAARVIAARWKQLAKKKLKIAVMARKNDVLQGENGLLNYLRKEGVPCAVDGKRSVNDTPLGALIIHLLHWMADPRATLYYGMAELVGLTTANPDETLDTWMKCISQDGFTAWLDLLFGVAAPIRERLSGMDLNVLDAVRHGLEKLDQKGRTDPIEAKRILELLQVQCSADENVVNLMTVHHSKGLTYDVVFSIFSGEINKEAYVACECSDDWVLERPILNSTYHASEGLSLARQQRREARMYDTLCMLYVAITRARYEQIVLAPKSDVITSKDELRLGQASGWLYQRFNVAGAPTCSGIADAQVEFPDAEHGPVYSCYSDGDPDWWQTLPDQDETSSEYETFQWEREAPEATVEVGLPSEHAKAKTIAELLTQKSVQAKGYGISLHECLAQVEWSDRPPEGLFADVFRQPKEPCELWRERPFSVRLEDEDTLRYVAGQFDRVHLFPERRSAIIYDFKTSQTAEVTPEYRTQMLKYQKALAVLTGYDVADIRMVLLFTRHHQAVEVVA